MVERVWIILRQFKIIRNRIRSRRFLNGHGTGYRKNLVTDVERHASAIQYSHPRAVEFAIRDAPNMYAHVDGVSHNGIPGVPIIQEIINLDRCKVPRRSPTPSLRVFTDSIPTRQDGIGLT